MSGRNRGVQDNDGDGPIVQMVLSEQGAGARLDRLPQVPWPEVMIYVVVAFGLSWLLALPLWVGRGAAAQEPGPLTTLLTSAIMFTPALAVLVVVLLAKKPETSRLRFLGMWPLRPAKRVVWFIVAALFAPIFLVAATVLVSGILGWIRLDVVNFSGFAETVGASLPAGSSGALPSVQVLVLAQVVAIPFGALVNSISAFGEELGWRGWLLPALRPLGVWPSLMLSGVIWGVWHAPLTLLGHNFGLYDWRGVVVMTVGSIAWGVLLGWSRIRSGSLWPAVVGHGSLNAAGAMFGLAAAAGQDPELWLVNPMGASGWIVLGIGALALLCAGQFRREPQLSAAADRT